MRPGSTPNCEARRSAPWREWATIPSMRASSRSSVDAMGVSLSGKRQCIVNTRGWTGASSLWSSWGTGSHW